MTSESRDGAKGDVRLERRAPAPSRYRIPQQCSSDRRRAREATLDLQRRAYVYQDDQGPGHPLFEGDETFALPRNAAMLPPGEGFKVEKKSRILLHKAALQIRAPFFLGMPHARRLDTEEDYIRTLAWMRRPPVTRTWKNDEEFGRQRLAGTNPMSLEHCAELPEGDLGETAGRVLSSLYKTTLPASHPRLFRTRYAEVLDPRIQKQVFHGTTLPATECLFYVTDYGMLMPIAIGLEDWQGARCVTTPLDPKPRWHLAKAHANCVDTHYHEGIFHLLETHMVSEVFKLATCRQLHPDHPLHQLLDPHFEHNLAIDHLARNNLLSVGGPIDTTMAAGVGGTMDLARLAWQKWSFEGRRFHRDLSARGVEGDDVIEHFPYRDDGNRLHGAIERYAEGMLRVWYRSDAEVVGDVELQAWSSELSVQVPDFPTAIGSLSELISIVGEVIFRASVQHSAVNNGQFDTYGFVPNSPGSVFAGIPVEELSLDLEERDVFRAMPRLTRSQAQLGMSWVLSQPTHRSLYASGESPAFSRELCLAAYEQVQAFREELRHITAKIDERNESLSVPYTYLNPHNIGRSTGI